MSETKTIAAFKALQAEELAIFERKNADYGDSFREDGVLGVMIRQKDKLSRFINLARQGGEGAYKEEALRDTLIDLANYAKMAIIAHEEGESWGDRKEKGCGENYCEACGGCINCFEWRPSCCKSPDGKHVEKEGPKP